MHEGTVNEDLLETYGREGTPVWRIYEPSSVMAVLGAAGDPSRDLILENLSRDGVSYSFRKGGGGTVILSPGQVVLAFVREVGSPFLNREYARRVNDWFVETLSGLGVHDISHRGISDLAIGERKILGTSIYRRRLALFYQASLLVSNDLALFNSYLTMPAREPDYRQGRGHEQFCTTLVREGYQLSTENIIEALAETVERSIGNLQ